MPRKRHSIPWKRRAKEGESKLETRRENKTGAGRYAGGRRWARLHHHTTYRGYAISFTMGNYHDRHDLNLGYDKRIQPRNPGTLEWYNISDANGDDNKPDSSLGPLLCDSCPGSNPLAADFDMCLQARYRGYG